jgi:hypothetical protein
LRARLLDGALALGLFVAVVGLLLASSDPVGYTRDETFYFHHSRVYMNWFTALGEAKDQSARATLLANDGIEKYWRSNWEHPPLAKVLIGASWRFLGQKKRAVLVPPHSRSLQLQDLGPSHGFQEGARVAILAPLKLGQDPDSPRLLGYATVTKRSPNKARADLAKGDPDAARLLQVCAHPPAPPSAMGPCQAVEQSPNLLLSEVQAYRFPGMLSFGLLCVLLFYLGRRWLARLPALFGALAFASIPQVFFHGHLACFDVPITALNLAVILAFRLQERRGGLPLALLTGLLWGLALLTKNNAFFVPVTLVLYFLATWHFRPKTWHLGPLAMPAIPASFFAMLFLGPLLLYLGWPLLWHDPVRHFGDYLAFHMKHEHYLQYYFGQVLQAPPFPISYPFVLTALMTPIPTLLLGLAGLAIFALPILRRGPGQTALRRVPTGQDLVFVLVNAAFPIVLIALPSTPIFGGLKHWLLTLAFLGFFAGIAFAAALGGLARALAGEARPPRNVFVVLTGIVLAALILAPAARDTARFVPFGTAYWNELVGGVRGAADLRLQRQFWSYASRPALDYLNRQAPAGASVDFQDATLETCQTYQKLELLRQDLRCVIRKPDAAFYLFDLEERFREEEFLRTRGLGAVGPVAESSLEGVPMVRVYARAPAAPTQPDAKTRGDKRWP